MKEGTNDTPHGIGIQVNKYGDIIEGYWKDGKLHGRGGYIWDDGCYIGEYKEGKWDGEGTRYWAEGDRYEGGFKDDKRYGQGTHYIRVIFCGI